MSVGLECVCTHECEFACVNRGLECVCVSVCVCVCVFACVCVRTGASSEIDTLHKTIADMQAAQLKHDATIERAGARLKAANAGVCARVCGRVG